jgi:hypothetical protein
MSDFATIESGTSMALWDWYRASSYNLKHFVTNKWMHCTDIPPESSLRILSITGEKATKLNSAWKGPKKQNSADGQETM